MAVRSQERVPHSPRRRERQRRSSLAAPANGTGGSSFSVTVTARDANANTATGYTGTVHFTNTDGSAALPANYTFTAGDSGVHVFNVTLNTAGSMSVTATDTVTSFDHRQRRSHSQGEHDDHAHLVGESIDRRSGRNVHRDGHVGDCRDDQRNGHIQGRNGDNRHGYDRQPGDVHDVIAQPGIAFDHGGLRKQHELQHEHVRCSHADR